MKEVVDKILEQVEADISEIDLYGYNIIETSLSMVHRLQSILNDLRTKIQTYVFLTKEDEILFFKKSFISMLSISGSRAYLALNE